MIASRLGRLAAVAMAISLAGCGFLRVPPPRDAQGPAPSPAAPSMAAAVSAPAPPGTAIVQPGENLYMIARRNNVPIRALIDANGLEPPYILHPGQQLTVPHPEVHVVTSGETLYGVARQYGVDPSAIVRANALPPPYRLIIGQQLILPGRVAPEPAATTPTAVAEVQHVELLPPPPSSTAPVPVATAPAMTAPMPTAASPSPAPQSIRAPSGVVVTPLPPPLPSPSQAATPAPAAQPATQPAARPSANPSLPAAETPVPPPAPPQAVATASPPTESAGASRGSEGKVAAVPPADAADGARFLWPVKGKIISGYGPKEGGLFNDGINIAATRGETVVAADDGVVVYAGNEIRGFGNLVLIKHANGWMTAYAHNDTLLVKRGERVRRGQPIARAGSSGSVSSPQVHFEIRQGSRAVDPTKYLAQLSS